MARKDAIEVEAQGRAAAPTPCFPVQLANGHRVLAHISGKCVCTSIRSFGDKVMLEVSPRFVEGANYLSPKMITRRRPRFFADYESRPSVKDLLPVEIVKRKNVLHVICKTRAISKDKG
jgi:translation initiation factor IF-1